MNNFTYKNHDAKDWITVNVSHKNAGDLLLGLTAYRDRRIQVHWLNPVGDVAVESLQMIHPRFPSLTPQLPELAWDEREIRDLFGYIPENHPDLRPLVRTARWPEGYYPLFDESHTRPFWHQAEPDNPAKTVEGEGVTIMKVGPTHAGIIESGHFIFSIMGENILHLDAHLFQNHRGVEKSLESLTVQEAAPMISRICGADTVSHQFNFVSAVEQLAGRIVPEALQWQRVILLEAERVLSHLNDLAQIPAGVGFQVANQKGLAMKEMWQRGLQRVFGHRYLFDALTFNRVSITDVNAFLSLLKEFEIKWFRWRRLVENQHGFHDRMRGTGVVKREDADRLGAVGVALRATGISFDARTLMPLYDDLDIAPPEVGGGDVEARFQVRLHEIESSMRLIKTALGQIRGRQPIDAWQPPVDLTGETAAYSESPHGLNVHVMQMEQGRIARYHVRSGAYRNWPVLALAVAGNAVADFPLINKSFELCYSCADR